MYAKVEFTAKMSKKYRNVKIHKAVAFNGHITRDTT